MGKLRQTALILGEGPTEFFYFKSLCDVFKRLTIKPDYPKHTNIKELDLKIADGIAMGYSQKEYQYQFYQLIQLISMRPKKNESPSYILITN